jgi:hypothetical protein
VPAETDIREHEINLVPIAGERQRRLSRIGFQDPKSSFNQMLDNIAAQEALVLNDQDRDATGLFRARRNLVLAPEGRLTTVTVAPDAEFLIFVRFRTIRE